MIKGTVLGITCWPESVREDGTEMGASERINLDLGGGIRVDVPVPLGTADQIGAEPKMLDSGAESYRVPAAKGKLLVVRGYDISEVPGKAIATQDGGTILRKRLVETDEPFELALIDRPVRALKLGAGFAKPTAA